MTYISSLETILRYLIIAAVLSFLPTRAPHAAALPDENGVRLIWGLQVPMRDGVHLTATAYVPKKQPPAPCILSMTPYTSDTYHQRGVYFAEHGFPFVLVDVRGRGNSEGQFRPFIQEAHDGYDVVEWLARQPYCNGKVGMWGGSYAGYDQWATAKEFPPHLATIAPAAAARPGVSVLTYNGILRPDDLRWLTLTSSRTAQWNTYNDDALWASLYKEWFESGQPFTALGHMTGNRLDIFDEWISHPHPDSYWDSFNPTESQYSQFSIPVLTITGSYDDEQGGALGHYKEFMKSASPQGREHHYLIIGPWDHAGTRTPQAEVGGVKFGESSLVDLPELHLKWYAWTMQNGPRPEFLKKHVAYYVMGAERWRYADTLEAVTSRSMPYFLSSLNNPTDVLSSGMLVSEPPPRSKPDHYVYDPHDVSNAELESIVDPASLVDQRLIYAGSGKQLLYHSAAFPKPMEISGFPKLSVWIAIDQPDTDFNVSIYEIGSDGNSILLATDSMRARYREGLRAPKLIRTRSPQRYDFEHFNFVSRQIAAGSRLRIAIRPVNSIYREKNYNSGGVVAEESIKDARIVTVSVFHDEAHPSALYVPVGVPE